MIKSKIQPRQCDSDYYVSVLLVPVRNVQCVLLNVMSMRSTLAV
jgi:hypothetical protein